MFQVFEPQEFRNLEHLMFQCSAFLSIRRFIRLMFGPPGAGQASIRSTITQRSVTPNPKVCKSKDMNPTTMTNARWRPSPRTPFIRNWGVFKSVSRFFFKFASKGSLWSGLPRRVRKVGVEGKVSRDLRADRLSLLAVLPAAGGGSCEALARWPAPRFNPGVLMLRPSPRIAGGRPPSPP